MPELPDVVVFKQVLDKNVLGSRVAKARVMSPDLLEGTSGAALVRRLNGHRLIESRRHGKYLFARIGGTGQWLVVHFGMTGFLKYFNDPAEMPEHTRLLMKFSDGAHLAYDCQRKLGEISLAENVDGFVRKRQLGPDPFDREFKLEVFKEILSGCRGAVKSTLMDQGLLAGIGNVYSDEILFHCRLHPKAKAHKLSSRTVRRLFTAIHSVLATAIRCKVDPARFPKSYLLPHRQKDGKCPGCGSKLQRIKVGGRTAVYCAKEQKLP